MELSVVKRQNRIKNGQVMATQNLAKSSRAANFEPIIGYLAHIFWDMASYFVMSIIIIKIEGQTDLKAKTREEIIIPWS